MHNLIQANASFEEATEHVRVGGGSYSGAFWLWRDWSGLVHVAAALSDRGPVTYCVPTEMAPRRGWRLYSVR